MSKVYHSHIADGVELTCVSAYKFKTGCLSMSLITQLDKKTASLNSVLPSVLRRGTARYPDMESLQRRLDDMYGARIEPVVRRKGELLCVGFYSEFLDDAFIPGGGHILDDVTGLMGELLLSPVTSGGRLRGDYVSGERDNLIDSINAAINDKRSYAVTRLLELMCRGERYGINKLGTLADANRVSVATLTRHYRQLLAQSRLEVFYCGSAEPSAVARAVREALAGLPRAAELTACTTEAVREPKGKNVRCYSDKLDITQGNLVMGYRMGAAAEGMNYPAMLVMNAVFGGSATSKLFLNVREKRSLCYFADSFFERHKGILLVSSGIDFDRYDETVSEITAQLEAVKAGQIEPWEFESARNAVVTSLSGAVDRLGRMEDMYLDRTISGMVCLPEELAALAEEVTMEDVVEAASGIKLDTVYFLTGEGSTDGA